MTQPYPIPFKSQIHGSLLGLAICDALGATNEFRSSWDAQEITGYVGGGTFGLAPGEWTDDTSMALCLAHSIIDRGFDMKDQLEKYLDWYRYGYMSSRNFCFDIGTTTSAALQSFQKTGNVIVANLSKDYFWSNGSIMRLAPVVLAYYAEPYVAVTLAGESSRTTHNSQVHVEACQYLAMIILKALQGFNKEGVLDLTRPPLGLTGFINPLDLSLDMLRVVEGNYKHEEFMAWSEGEVSSTLATALWAFHHTETFEEGALLIANLGGDCDTIGAVYGQVAGAYYGTQGIPTEWIRSLHDLPLLVETAGKLYYHGEQRQQRTTQ